MNRTIYEREIYTKKLPIKLQVNNITRRNSPSVPNENSLMVDFSALDWILDEKTIAKFVLDTLPTRASRILTKFLLFN